MGNLVFQVVHIPWNNGCFLFPFGLWWANLKDKEQKKFRSYCANLVPNLKIDHLFVTFLPKTGLEDFTQLDDQTMGYRFEELVLSSIAAKFFLYHSVTDELPSFSEIYDFNVEPDFEDVGDKLNDRTGPRFT